MVCVCVGGGAWSGHSECSVIGHLTLSDMMSHGVSCMLCLLRLCALSHCPPLDHQCGTKVCGHGPPYSHMHACTHHTTHTRMPLHTHA